MMVIGIAVVWLLEIFFVLLIARMVLSWIPVFNPEFTPRGAMLVVCESVYTLTDPPIKAFRKVLPSPGIGNVRIDLSFLAVVICVMLAQGITRVVFF